jgi:DNA-binding transcriptional ArsR family regulator
VKPNKEVFWIEDEETFELLADQTRIQIIEMLGEPRSVTALAEAMNVPRTRLYHHIKLLEESGLIEVVETRKAGALTEKIYLVAASSYQPSHDFVVGARPSQQRDAILGAVLGATQADFARALEEEGLAGLEEHSEHKRMTLGRMVFQLTPDHLQNLVMELEGLLDRYLHLCKDDPEAIPVAAVTVVYPRPRGSS